MEARLAAYYEVGVEVRMIVWQGFGFFAALIPIVAYVLVVKLCALAMGAAYTGTHAWPGALGTLLGAIGVWALARALDDPKPMLMDEGYGPVMERRKHTLFFMPLLYVAAILALIALAMLIFRHSSPL